MKLKYSFCAALASLLLILPACGNGSLKDVTKPYLGEYECQSATLGEKDYAQDFFFIRLVDAGTGKQGEQGDNQVSNGRIFPDTGHDF